MPRASGVKPDNIMRKYKSQKMGQYVDGSIHVDSSPPIKVDTMPGSITSMNAIQRAAHDFDDLADQLFNRDR